MYISARVELLKTEIKECMEVTGRVGGVASRKTSRMTPKDHATSVTLRKAGNQEAINRTMAVEHISLESGTVFRKLQSQTPQDL